MTHYESTLDMLLKEGAKISERIDEDGTKWIIVDGKCKILFGFDTDGKWIRCKME